MTIYVDEIFMVNFFMDALVIWVTGQLTQQTAVWWRQWCAAGIGAIYGILLFWPEWSWLSHGFIKMLIALLMVRVSFRWQYWRLYLKAVLYLYLSSFAFGGSVLALMYFRGKPFIQTWNGIAFIQTDFNLFWLIFGTILLLVLITILQRTLVRRLEDHLQIVSADLSLRGKSVSLNLLVDTGNCLVDPVTGRAVVIVQAQSLRPLLTEQEYEQIKAGILSADIDVTTVLLQLSSLSGRVRLLPYRTVGYQGFLLGIRCDLLRVPKWNMTQTEVVVALSAQPFSMDCTYQGIISPNMCK